MSPIIVLEKQTWPTQAQARTFYGAPGTNLTLLPCPWQLTYLGLPVAGITINKNCADSLRRVLEYVWELCDEDQDKINSLHYNRFSGSYNDRNIRGGSSPSMHSYGAAIDWDDQENQQHSQHHVFTRESPLIAAFLQEGWIWGGDWSPGSIDAMHVQAARVR